MLNAVARSRGGNVSWIMPSTCGATSPPATPCTSRAAMSVPADGAAALRAEAIVNDHSPTMKTRRGPSTSPRRPPLMRRVA